MQDVITMFQNFNANKGDWNQPFNQVLFLNYDTTNVVKINDQPIPPAIVQGGFIYPSQLSVCLNVGEVNKTSFSFDFGQTTAAQLHVLFTKYL